MKTLILSATLLMRGSQSDQSRIGIQIVVVFAVAFAVAFTVAFAVAFTVSFTVTFAVAFAIGSTVAFAISLAVTFALYSVPSHLQCASSRKCLCRCNRNAQSHL